MPTFPVLTATPAYPLKESREDNAIKSDTEAGYVIIRARYSRIRKTFTVRYDLLSAADKATLEAFVVTVGGTIDYFTWIHPASGTSYVVRFEKSPEFELAQYDGSNYLYNTDFILREV